jgi:hypothetical protein
MWGTAQFPCVGKERIAVAAEEEFQFLTMEEFSRLSRRDKGFYLEAAAAKIKEMHGEAAGYSLFKDAPEPPLAPLSDKPA